MVGSIQIRNPRIREIVTEELEHGAGRTAAEAAENLIRDGAERRRIERAQRVEQPKAPEPSAA